jgi:hypothetical protein
MLYLSFFNNFMAMGVPSGGKKYLEAKKTWKTWTRLENKSLGGKCIRNTPRPPSQTLKPQIFLIFCPFWAICKMWVCQLELYNPFFEL